MKKEQQQRKEQETPQEENANQKGGAAWGNLLEEIIKSQEVFLTGSDKELKSFDAMEVFVYSLSKCDGKSLNAWLDRGIMGSPYWDMDKVLMRTVLADWVEGYEAIKAKSQSVKTKEWRQVPLGPGSRELETALHLCKPKMIEHLWEKVDEKKKTIIANGRINPKSYSILMGLGKAGIVLDDKKCELALLLLSDIKEKEAAEPWENKVLKSLYEGLSQKSLIHVWSCILRGKRRQIAWLSQEGLLPSKNPLLVCAPVDFLSSDRDYNMLPLVWHDRSTGTWTKEAKKPISLSLPELAALAHTGIPSEGDPVLESLMKKSEFKEALIASPVAVHFILKGQGDWEGMVKMGIPIDKIQDLDGNNPMHILCEGGMTIGLIEKMLQKCPLWVEQKNKEGKLPVELFRGSDSDRELLQAYVDKLVLSEAVKGRGLKKGPVVRV